MQRRLRRRQPRRWRRETSAWRACRYSRLHPGKTRQRQSRRMMGSLTLRDGGHSASKTRVNALEATSSAGGERTASHLLVHHAVAQRTDAGDLDLEHVTGLHPQWWIAAMADPFRRAGGDHVTRQERREVRAERDDLRHRIDQEIGG